MRGLSLFAVVIMTVVGLQRLGLRALRPPFPPRNTKRCCFRPSARMSTAESKTEVVKGTKDDMKGKNVIITGANSGIGLALSKRLVLRGAHVPVAVRDNAKGAECVAASHTYCHLLCSQTAFDLIARPLTHNYRASLDDRTLRVYAYEALHACIIFTCTDLWPASICAVRSSLHTSAGLSKLWKRSLHQKAAVALQMPSTLTCSPSSTQHPSMKPALMLQTPVYDLRMTRCFSKQVNMHSDFTGPSKSLQRRCLKITENWTFWSTMLASSSPRTPKRRMVWR